jgi:hypothetical protein
MNTLKGGVSDKVLPLAEAESVALKMISNNWRDHFATRAFGSMELSGRGQNRNYFAETITPDALDDIASLEVEVMPQLPEDDAAKMQLAQLARQPGPSGRPLVSDYTVRERYLQMQNSDLEDAAISQEMAGQNPMVQAQRMSDAAAERGDMDAAQAWHIVWKMQVIQLQQALQQQNMTIDQILAEFQPGPGPITGGGPEGNGFSPESLPNSAQGIRPPQVGVDTPGQTGPLVDPGTERPGAQNRNGSI